MTNPSRVPSLTDICERCGEYEHDCECRAENAERRVAELEDAMKASLCGIREECESGSREMHAVDDAWLDVFGDSPDAPWKASLPAARSDADPETTL